MPAVFKYLININKKHSAIALGKGARGSPPCQRPTPARRPTVPTVPDYFRFVMQLPRQFLL